MQRDDFKMTVDQFISLVKSSQDLVEYWNDTRGEPGVPIDQDIRNYLSEYVYEDDSSDFIYWLLIEMGVIDPERAIDPLVQKFVDIPHAS